MNSLETNGEDILAFVNEIVSEEDIKRFGLDELMAKFNQWSWQQGRPEGFRHHWTVDHDREIFLLLAKVVQDIGPSGRSEPSSRRLFILGWKGHVVEVLLELGDESSKNFKEKPYRITWNLVSIQESGPSNIEREKVLEELKAALICHGYKGALKQIEGTLVECRF